MELQYTNTSDGEGKRSTVLLCVIALCDIINMECLPSTSEHKELFSQWDTIASWSKSLLITVVHMHSDTLYRIQL